MELYFLDENFKIISPPVDTAVSVVWSLRYHECGSFAVHLPLTEGVSRTAGGLKAKELIALASTGTYLCGREYCGRIESVIFRENTVELSGRTLECLLYDRVAAETSVYMGTATEAIRQALEQWAADTALVWGDTQPVLGEARRRQVGGGKTLGAWMHELTADYGGSFTVRLGEDGKPVLTLLQGVDRSLDGDPGRGRAVFDEDFGNIAELETERYRENVYNRVYIEGGDGTVETADAGVSPAQRRERYIKAADILPEAYETEEAYRAALRTRGNTLLLRGRESLRLSCTAEDTALPIYGTDYTLGDICEIRSSLLGISAAVRLTALDIVCESGTRKLYPIFGDSVLRIRTAIYEEGTFTEKKG